MTIAENTPAVDEPRVPEQLALVYGQSFTEMPVDLYIPPDALEVFLEASRAHWTCCCT